MNYEYDASWKLYGDQWINDDKCYIISMMINVKYEFWNQWINDDKCYISMMINVIYWILKAWNL